MLGYHIRPAVITKSNFCQIKAHTTSTVSEMSENQHNIGDMTTFCRYIRLILPWALYVRLLIFGAALTWMWSTTRWSVSSPLNSALLSAFFKSCSKNSADFLGHLPWQAPHCLHYKKRKQKFLRTGIIFSCNLLHICGFQMATFTKNCVSDWHSTGQLCVTHLLDKPFLITVGPR